MTKQELIQSLRNRISDSLDALIDNDYLYLELPYYSNIGDTLIWKGTEDYLCKLPYRCLYRCSFETFEYQEVNPDVIILLQGGGNFGDLYYNHNKFRNRILGLYPNNKIIILPQTVYYKSCNRLIHDVKIMSSHKNLYICARDTYSYEFLKEFNFCKNILLLPDMAFCISESYLNRHRVPQSDRTLVFKRKDKETSKLSNIEKLAGGESECRDWPLYEDYDPRLRTLERLMYMEKKYVEANDYAVSIYMPARVCEGIGFISKYKYVFSNRLHGSILSILLNIDVTLIDNSYGKNAQFYDTWLTNTQGIDVMRFRKKTEWIRNCKMLFAKLILKCF